MFDTGLNDSQRDGTKFCKFKLKLYNIGWNYVVERISLSCRWKKNYKKKYDEIRTCLKQLAGAACPLHRRKYSSQEKLFFCQSSETTGYTVRINNIRLTKITRHVIIYIQYSCRIRAPFLDGTREFQTTNQKRFKFSACATFFLLSEIRLVSLICVSSR